MDLSVNPLNRTLMFLEALKSFGAISGNFTQGSIVDEVTQ